jgi:hypothetical protein
VLIVDNTVGVDGESSQCRMQVIATVGDSTVGSQPGLDIEAEGRIPRAKPDRRGERQRQATAKARRMEAAAVEETGDATGMATVDHDQKSSHLEAHEVELGAQIGAAIAAAPNRAGERARQKRRREEKAETAKIEEASKRLRAIATIDDAMTPAQRTMARLKARVVAKQCT